MDDGPCVILDNLLTRRGKVMREADGVANITTAPRQLLALKSPRSRPVTLRRGVWRSVQDGVGRRGEPLMLDVCYCNLAAALSWSTAGYLNSVDAPFFVTPCRDMMG